MNINNIKGMLNKNEAETRETDAGQPAVAAPLPAWFDVMDEEDRQFLKRFLLASGSLKDLAGLYGVSYPTVRLRLDRLIAKVQAADEARGANNPFERKLQLCVAAGTLSPVIAKELLAAHRQSQRK